MRKTVQVTIPNPHRTARQRRRGIHRSSRTLSRHVDPSALRITLLASLALLTAPLLGSACEHRGGDGAGAGLPSVSENFVVEWCPGVQKDPAFLGQLLEYCEARRAELIRHWHGGVCTSRWRPRCTLALHPHREAYAARLGAAVGDSVACATIRRRAGRIVERRIDLRLDAANWRLDALPHELTHLVLWDLVPPEQLPPWAAEGIAALSESPAKRAARLAALQATPDWLRYDLEELLRVRTLPPPQRRVAFYSQSLQLVEAIVRANGRRAFVDAIAKADQRTLASLLAGLSPAAPDGGDGAAAAGADTSAVASAP